MHDPQQSGHVQGVAFSEVHSVVTGKVHYDAPDTPPWLLQIANPSPGGGESAYKLFRLSRLPA